MDGRIFKPSTLLSLSFQSVLKVLRTSIYLKRIKINKIWHQMTWPLNFWLFSSWVFCLPSGKASQNILARLLGRWLNMRKCVSSSTLYLVMIPALLWTVRSQWWFLRIPPLHKPEQKNCQHWILESLGVAITVRARLR